MVNVCRYWKEEPEDCACTVESLRLTIAARDKEWVEWINKLPYEQFDKEGFPTENDSEVTQRMFLIGYETLKNRKQEIGL